MKRIVILGGGFGGVYAAMQLEKLLATDGVAEICLVSHDNFFLFTPMLHARSLRVDRSVSGAFQKDSPGAQQHDC